MSIAERSRASLATALVWDASTRAEPGLGNLAGV
jgi:hypothetical protein